MSEVLKELKPYKVFKYFEEICGIPHASGNKEPIKNYCVNFAKEHHLSCEVDDYMNVIITKEASAGYESAPTVIIQGHLDMVAEKTRDSKHNFDTDPLELKIVGDSIYANNTTLGGDDGIAIAYALAILDDEDILHGRIIAIFTANEEIGLLGATYLDAKYLNAKYLLNIDSEEEGIFLNSCAGGNSFSAHLKYNCEDVIYKNIYTIDIFGLLGGHSGTEIDKFRANAGKIAGNFLAYLNENTKFQVININGGKKDNAIMRETCITVASDCKEDEMRDILNTFTGFTKIQYLKNDPAIEIDIKINDKKIMRAIRDSDKNKLINYLLLSPDGVIEYENVDNHYVQTSLNLGVITMDENEILITHLVRSSIDFVKENIIRTLKGLCGILDIEYTMSGNYPGWTPRENSHLIDVMKRVYLSQYGKEAVVCGVHAGLECGIFYKKNPDLDIVSFGPDIFDIHTPKEHLSISSVSRVWYFIIDVLENLKD